MKVAVIFLSLVLYLLGGVNVVHAESQDAANPVALHILIRNSNQVKVYQSVPTTFSITTAEFDLEEECADNDTFKSSNPTIHHSKDFFVQAWYIRVSAIVFVHSYRKNFKIFAPFCGQSNPIYIIQQVLRI